MTTSATEFARILSMRNLNITITAAMYDTYGEKFCADRITAAIGIAKNFGGRAIVISFNESGHWGLNEMAGKILHVLTRDGVKTRIKLHKSFLNMAIYFKQQTKAPQNG